MTTPVRDIESKKWALEFALRVPNNQAKSAPYLGQVQQNVIIQKTTEEIISEATKVFNWLNGTN